MCKYLLDLIGFNADKPEDYYDSKLQLSTLHMYDSEKCVKCGAHSTLCWKI